MNTLAVAVVGGPPSYAQSVVWQIDGRDLREWVAEAERRQNLVPAGDYGGTPIRHADPIAVALGVRADPLLFYAPGEAHSPYISLAVCSCGDESCNDVIADLIIENGSVVWTNVRRQVEDGSDMMIHHLGLSFAFDEAQYRHALAAPGRLPSDAQGSAK